jgi:hypothetical protein
VIRSLVVDLGDWVLDTGDWIPGRKVIVSSTVFGQLNQETSLFPVKLTKMQVENNPSFDLDGYNDLYSMKAVLGSYIQAADGDIGHLEDFIVEDQGWMIHSISISTRNWLPGKKVTIAPTWIKSIALGETRVYIDLPRELES